jgi:hypothetical protein
MRGDSVLPGISLAPRRLFRRVRSALRACGRSLPRHDRFAHIVRGMLRGHVPRVGAHARACGRVPGIQRGGSAPVRSRGAQPILRFPCQVPSGAPQQSNSHAAMGLYAERWRSPHQRIRSARMSCEGSRLAGFCSVSLDHRPCWNWPQAKAPRGSWTDRCVAPLPSSWRERGPAAS